MRVIVSFCFIALTSATLFQDCGSKGKNVVFNVEGCDTPPCIMQRGKTYHLTIQFDEAGASDTLTVDASANIGGVNVPWPGIETDGCKVLEDTKNPCPLEDGSSVDWQEDVEVLNEYPKITTTVTFKLTDDDKDSQVCAKVPVEVV